VCQTNVSRSRTGEFRYVSAGHPGPVHLTAGGAPVILEGPEFLPIGLVEGAYGERSVRLAAGDRLYLYSDGVTEAMDPAGQLFGEARLLEAIGRGRSVPLEESVAALVGEVERWRGAASAQDDISILAVEVSVASGSGEPRVDPRPTSHDTMRAQ
jgi:phosphoserine phosphatase RsbU/P